MVRKYSGGCQDICLKCHWITAGGDVHRIQTENTMAKTKLVPDTAWKVGQMDLGPERETQKI